MKARKSSRVPTKRRLGCWYLGLQSVELIVDQEMSDGWIKIWPEVGKPAQICVGLKQNHWSRVLEVLIHEAMEFSFIMVGGRMSPDPDMAQSNGGYLFVLNHTSFEDAVARSAQFLHDAIPVLKKAFDAKPKEKKK